MVGRRARGLLGLDLGLLRGDRRRLPYERVLGSREMPGAEWFPGTRLNYAEHVFRGHADDEVAIVHASELRELGELTWGELRRRGRPRRRRAARARGGGGRPRRRLPAERRRGGRRLPRHRLARRDLVLGLARLRRRLGDRPLRPDRAEGADRLSTATATAARTSPAWRWSSGCARRCSASSTPCCCSYLGAEARAGGRDRLGGARRRPTGAELELHPRPLRGAALGPLLLRHHRACRRRSSRARAGSCSST